MSDEISLKDRIQHIIEGWFLTEPALFFIFCTHEMRPNSMMQIPIRTGKGLIEYNEAILGQLPSTALEEHLKIEMVRLLLKHPYERQPLGSRAEALHVGSDLVIGQFYPTSFVKMLPLEIFNLPENQSFEWYVRELNEILENLVPPLEDKSDSSIYGGVSDDREKSSDSNEPAEYNAFSAGIGSSKKDIQSNQQSKGRYEPEIQIEGIFGSESKEYTELWEEDDEWCMEINNLITKDVKNWGNIPDELVEIIKAAAEGKIDYRRVLSGFRASIISSKRRLTRMKPSRRYGFMYMGSTFDLSTKLLVAIDVSGSVSSETISYFLNVIKRFFRYGISEIDIIQFDTEVKKDVKALNEYSKELRAGFIVTGRGGTNFQPVFDYLKEHNHYDGLIIFTDGYAAKPTINFYTRTKVLWVLKDDRCYLNNHSLLESVGRVCAMNR